MAVATELTPIEPQVRTALPESRGYRLKRRLLGEPLVTAQLSGERLSNPVALGVLSPDCISSSAYGTEEMLVILIPYIGLAAFSVVLPITIAILVVLTVVTLSYREVVMTYTKAGGSYVVARDNFGVRVAQVAAVALLIDYTVTVAVQTAAATAALTSAVPSLRPEAITVTIAVVAVLVLLWGNLRGIREAGRTFAAPTYLFIAMMTVVIIAGLIRQALGTLGKVNVHASGALPLGTHSGSGLLMGATVFIALKAFANGGSSLTGLEAISNGVSAFRPPEGRNARQTLVIMSSALGFLVLGVSLLAHFTHAIPYSAGSPTVISQEAKVVFGHGTVGTVGYYAVQAATMLILYTGANTSFNGFPFLASFVAEDRFLPFKLTKRGHRLAFSNGIIILAALAIALLIVSRAKVNELVAVYAIGVFTGFTMAGAGMVKHHLTHPSPRRGLRIAINGAAAVLSAAVVIIFGVTKFTEGAWLVIVLFPLLIFTFIRLNRQYREEASALGETVVAVAAAEARPLPRQVAMVMLDRLDLATARAIQYARALSVDDVRAVHFVIDSERANQLEQRWVRLGLTRLPLELVDCPDRRIIRAALEMADEAADGQTEVTILLPRRAYRRGWDRILHDSTGERIAAALSRLPHVNATIVPFDVDAALADLHHRGAGRRPAGPSDLQEQERAEEARLIATLGGITPIGMLRERQRARVVGRVRSLTVQPWGSVPTLECVLTDEEHRLIVAFLGRRQIPGLTPGVHLLVEGTVSARRGRLVMINPTYEFASVP
jgi:amino acid transporter